MLWHNFLFRIITPISCDLEPCIQVLESLILLTILIDYSFLILYWNWVSFFRYVKLYGLKFSKEDHLAVINLLLSVLHIPDLDPWLTNRTACSIRDLLRKRDLLTRDDLHIEWRPLYELYEKLFYSPNEALGLVHYPK